MEKLHTLCDSPSAEFAEIGYFVAAICVVLDETRIPVPFDTAAASPLWQLLFSINVTYIVTGCSTHSLGYK